MSNIGYSTLSVIPSARGFGAALTKGIAPQMAVAGKASGLAFGKAMVGGMAVIATAGVAVTGALFAVGKTFHDMESGIRVGTGKSGKALDGLVASALNVGKKVPSSFEDIGKTVTVLNQRLGLTGPVLETLTKQALIAGRITKQSLDLTAVTGSFNAFNIKGNDTTKALDDLFRISQATGTPINELASAAIRGAPAFRQFGMSFSTSAALMGVLDKSGINTGKTIMALTIGLTKFAKEGKKPGPALRATIDQIQKLTKSGKDAAAIKLASAIFGTRGASQFVAAVKSGKVNLDDMMKSAGAGKDTILKAGTAVSTFSSKWLTFKNNVLIAVKPIADKVFKAFGDGMQWMSDTGLPALQKFGSALSDTVSPALKTIGDFFTGTVNPALKVFFAFLTGNDAGVGAGRFTEIAKAGTSVKDALDKIVPPIKVFFAFLTGNSAGIGAGKFTDVANAALKIRDGISKVADFITGTALPALGNIATWITGTGIPALSNFKDWVIKNRDTLKVLAEFIGVVLLPVFVNMAAKAVASAATQAGAWVSTQIAGVASAASQLASHYVIVGGWVVSTAKAVASAATTAVIWGMYQKDAAIAAAKTAVAFVIIAAGWVSTAATAMASAVTMAAAWVIGLGPVAWVIAGVVALIGVIVLIAKKTTWFQTAWNAVWGVIGTPVKAVWGWIKSNWPLLLAILTGPIGLAVLALVKNWDSIKSGFRVMTDALATAWRWMWNSVLAPIIRFVLNGFATITDGIANMLKVLSNIPGFKWAKDAADKMSGAADKAHALANGIKDIPDKKTIDITARFTSVVANATASAAHNLGARAAFASGGPVPGSGYGDTVPSMLTPGEFVVRRDGSNIADALKHFGAKAVTPVAGIDYDRLAQAMSRVRVNSYLDGKNVTAAVDQRLAPR